MRWSMLPLCALLACAAPSAPKPAPHALPVPSPAQKTPIQYVSLESIAEELPDPLPHTFIAKRDTPSDGVREQRSGVTVKTDSAGALDWLVDEKGFVVPALSADSDRDLESLGGDGFKGSEVSATRVLKLVSVSERYASYYEGRSLYTAGAAHANNDLACVTYDRQTRQKISLPELLPPEEATSLLARAARWSEDNNLPPTVSGFLLRGDEVIMCINADDSIIAELPATLL